MPRRFPAPFRNMEDFLFDLTEKEQHGGLGEEEYVMLAHLPSLESMHRLLDTTRVLYRYEDPKIVDMPFVWSMLAWAPTDVEIFETFRVWTETLCSTF